MGSGAGSGTDGDVEPVTGDEPAGCGEQHGERRVALCRRRKQYAQRVALIQMVETSDAAAAAEVDFGRTRGQ